MMCFSSEKPKPPVHTPSFAPSQAHTMFNVQEEDQAGNTRTIQEGIGAPPSSADDNIRGGGQRVSRSDKQIRM